MKNRKRIYSFENMKPGKTYALFEDGVFDCHLTFIEKSDFIYCPYKFTVTKFQTQTVEAFRDFIKGSDDVFACYEVEG